MNLLTPELIAQTEEAQRQLETPQPYTPPKGEGGPDGQANNVSPFAILLPLPKLGIMAKLGSFFGFGVKATEEAGAAGTYEELVRAAQAKYPKKAFNIEYHHIEPMYIGGAKSGALVPLDAAYHQMITNAFRDAYPYGLGVVENPIDRLEIMNKVYNTYPLPPGYWPR